jgi:hypothetical protein
MESEESQKQASHAFHGSLEISHKTRDSHISTAPMTRLYLSEQAKPGEEMGGRGKVEIQNQDFHFPTAPISLRRKEEITSKNDKSKSHLHKTLDTAEWRFHRATWVVQNGSVAKRAKGFRYSSEKGLAEHTRLFAIPRNFRVLVSGLLLGHFARLAIVPDSLVCGAFVTVETADSGSESVIVPDSLVCGAIVGPLNGT